MRLYVFLLFLFIHCITVSAQSTIGLTGKRDTSYSTYSAYISTKKTNPNITIVPELHSAAVAEERNIAYCKTDSRTLYLDAFYPKEKRKTSRPAIVIIHGGGWRTGN